MSSWEALLLGVVQGLTEFLPISSSGHLAILQILLGWRERSLIAFNVALHFGTLISVLVYFRNDIRILITNCTLSTSDTVILILMDNVPTALIALALQSWTDAASHSLSTIALFLSVTASVLLLAEYISCRDEDKLASSDSGLTWRHALLIGAVQGVAVLPGLSRAGVTIACGLLLGLRKETSARFAFLVSIPAMFGAAALKTKELFRQFEAEIILVAAAAFVAFLIGLVAIDLCLKAVRGARLWWFAAYCLLVACVIGLKSIN